MSMWLMSLLRARMLSMRGQQALNLVCKMEDISRIQKVIIELRKRGYTEYEIRHIAGGNFLRVMEQAQRLAD